MKKMNDARVSTEFAINKVQVSHCLDFFNRVNMNHHTYHSPFGSPADVKQPLPRNYAEAFNPEDYECKDSIELESYARNLHNYLMGLLKQQPFPAFLFEKLEKRLDGITSILQKRSSASTALNKEAASSRLQALAAKLDSATVETESLPPPVKKRRVEAPCIKDVKESMAELRRLKRSYSDSQSTQPVEEEEED